MEKIEKDGMVAVLVSPGYGAGWSSWADAAEQATILCMDARIVGAFMNGGGDSAEQVALSLFPDFYPGGAKKLEIQWVPKGMAFEIEEYDGSESLHIIGSRPYHVA